MEVITLMGDFEPSPVMIRKYCHRKYNISRGCNTLRIGNLYKFREIENKKLKDEGEGLFIYKLEEPGGGSINIPRSEWNRIQRLAGIRRMYIARGQEDIADDYFVRFGPGSWIEVQAPNCWMLSLSLDTEGQAGKITKAYKDHWQFDARHLLKIQDYIGQLLRDTIKVSHLDASLFDRIPVSAVASGLEIRPVAHPVVYGDRVISIGELEQLGDNALQELRWRAAFTKTHSFEGEKEFRMAWNLYLHGQQISVSKEFVDLDLKPILATLGLLD